MIFPSAEEISAILFVGRDEKAVSPLKPAEKGSISQLCQESVFETCSAVMGRLNEFKYQDAREYRIRIGLWQITVRPHRPQDRQPAFCSQRSSSQTAPDGPTLRGDPGDPIRHRKDQPDIQSIPEIRHRTAAESASRERGGLIRKKLTSIRRQASNRIEMDCSQNLPTCKWDSIQISEAIAELIENAIYYTPPEEES